jgi:hypothetical protein
MANISRGPIDDTNQGQVVVSDYLMCSTVSTVHSRPTEIRVICFTLISRPQFGIKGVPALGASADFVVQSSSLRPLFVGACHCISNTFEARLPAEFCQQWYGNAKIVHGVFGAETRALGGNGLPHEIHVQARLL